MKNYKLFTEINRKAPVGLYDNVILAIEREDARISRRNTTYGIVSAVVSFLALIPAGYYFVVNISSSSFWNYLSLIFSDSGIITTYWKELLLSLVESFSFVEYSAVLVCLFVLFVSLRMIVRNRSNLSFNRLQIN